MRYLLLTGATGLLGRYLVRDLLLAGVRLAVLVRPTRRANVRQRMESLLCYWDAQLPQPLPRPIILEGDICQPGLGVSPEEERWVAEHCHALMHNAASLSFQSTGPESEPWRSNLHGTRHVLDFCEKTGITEFHHISTAYVCGLREGRVLETELDVGQTPGNDYERSKIMAETLVHKAAFLNSRTFYRPSIIVGDAQTGYTTTFHGFYAPLQLVQTMVRIMPTNATGWSESLARLELSGEESKNFVPVDWVSAVTTRIYTQPEHHGRTYHVTPEHPVKARTIGDVLEQTTRHYAVNFEGRKRPPEELTEVERVFHDHMQVYNSYWRDDPIFDTTNTRAAVPDLPCPMLDRPTLLRLANWAIETNFGGAREKPVDPEFDVHEHLVGLTKTSGDGKPCAASASANWLGLQVDGHGGGQWQLMLEDGKLLAAEQGLHDRCTATYRLNVDTLALLAQGQMSADQAIASGDIEILGNGVARSDLLSALEQIACPVGE